VADSVLTEPKLDRRYLNLTLVQEEFLNYATLQVADFDLNNEPAGLVIESVTGITRSRVRIDLAYTGIDFDVAINNFSVSISNTVLKQTGSGVLTSNSLTIYPYVEVPIAVLVHTG
jgi:hypothetical protein